MRLAIIGGGLAGLAAGILARRRGWTPTLFETQQLPIAKPCGEGLTPATLDQLSRLGVQSLQGHPLRGIRFIDGNDSCLASFHGRQGLGLPRFQLHQALLDVAESLQLKICQQKVALSGIEELRRSQDAVLLATGARSSLVRDLSFPSWSTQTHRVGVSRHFRVKPWSEEVEVHWGPLGEAYITPVGERLVNCALLFSAGSRPDKVLESFPQLSRRLQDPLTAFKGRGPFGKIHRQLHRDQLFLLGDAAGCLDPITGKGMSLAFASAELAIHCIATGRPERYTPSWYRMSRYSRGLTRLLTRVGSVGLLRRNLVRVLAKVPWVMDLTLNRLAEGIASDLAEGCP